MSETIRVSEIFGPTIQGEGVLIGQPTVFVRTGGCDYRCTWCDTPHAVDSVHRKDWTPMSAAEVFTAIEKLAMRTPLMVSLSGGNPAIQPLGPLIKTGKAKGYRFALETQGSIPQDWFAGLDVLTLSPKPPSSAMDTDLATLEACIKAGGTVPHTVLKFVVFDEADYLYARKIAALYPDLPVYLQPGNHTFLEDEPVDTDGLNKRLQWLAARVIEDRWFEAHVLPQLHVMMWGNQRGV